MLAFPINNYGADFIIWLSVDLLCAYYTLTETAKANGLNIRLYLETVMGKMLDYKNEPESILEELMPWSEAMKRSCSLENGNV